MNAQGHSQWYDLLSLVPLLVMMVPLAIGFTFVAGRIGRNQVLWAIMSLIPFVNYFFWMYAWFVIVLYIIDKLKAIGERVGAAPAAR